MCWVEKLIHRHCRHNHLCCNACKAETALAKRRHPHQQKPSNDSTAIKWVGMIQWLSPKGSQQPLNDKTDIKWGGMIQLPSFSQYHHQPSYDHTHTHTHSKKSYSFKWASLNRGKILHLLRLPDQKSVTIGQGRLCTPRLLTLSPLSIAGTG